MFTSRTPSRRRRSHSVAELSPSPSPSPASNRINNDAWRSSTKRNHPLSPTHDPSPYKWDVDMWRRGKRARMNPSSSPQQSYRRLSSSDTSSNSDEQSPHTASPLLAPSFASTSAAFHLFPARHGNVASLRTANQPRSDPTLSSQGPPPKRSRSHAFNDLHRTIAENGESLVGRLRNFEERGYGGGPSTAQQAAFAPRGRSSYTSHDGDVDFEDPFRQDADEDVQIISDEADKWSPRKKRATSLGGANFASDFTFQFQDELREGHRTDHPPISSPGATRASSPSLRSWVDVGVEELEEEQEFDNEVQELPFSRAALPSPPMTPYHPIDRMDFTPELSHTLTNSTNSSLISLSLASSAISSSPIYPRSLKSSRLSMQHYGGAPLPLALQASREEKAIAALTLAMANGAGGVSDYYEGTDESMRLAAVSDNDYAGDLWN